MKTCSRCRVAKPHDDFGRARTRDGYQAYCKPCAAAYLREARQRHPERFRDYERKRDVEKRRARDRERWAKSRADRDSGTRARFARKIRHRYGITLAEYDALVAAPCGLCGKTENIVLDHSHKTGLIRGPLCKGCNVALGLFGDDPSRMRAAADYVELHG